MHQNHKIIMHYFLTCVVKRCTYFWKKSYICQYLITISNMVKMARCLWHQKLIDSVKNLIPLYSSIIFRHFIIWFLYVILSTCIKHHILNICFVMTQELLTLSISKYTMGKNQTFILFNYFSFRRLFDQQRWVKC